jgi:flagellar motor switch protein FliG
MDGNATNSLLKKASEHAIAIAIKNSSSPKANKKRDSMSQRTSK